MSVEEEMDQPIDFSQASDIIVGPDEIDAEKNIDFEFIKGKRSDQMLLFSKREKQIYTKKREVKKHTVYHCRVKSCKSKIFVLSNGCAVFAEKFVPHNHPDQLSYYNDVVCRNEFLDAAMNIDIDINTAYRRVAER